MIGLADVPPPELAVEEFDIRGKTVRVRGLSGEEWAQIYTRFPAVAAGLAGQSGAQPLRIDELRSQAAIIAAAFGMPGDAKTEALVFSNLSGNDIQLLSEAAFRLSMPGHLFGPLLNGAAHLGAALDIAVPATK